MLVLKASDETEAFSLVTSDKLDEAVAACVRALHARPDDASALHAWGLAEFKRARYAEALDLFEHALTIDARDPFLHNNCGEAHRLLGDFDRAFECFRAALLIDNTNAVPHINLGIIMYARGKLAEAEHFFRNAVQCAPEMARPYIELAEFYREEGEGFKALPLYKQGIALSPDFIPWQTRLATLLVEQGNTQEALVVLRRATEAPGADVPAWYERARMEFELCNEDAAQAAYRRATEGEPGLSPHVAQRLVATRRIRPQAYCNLGAGECIELARAQWLRLPPPPSIPPEASRFWTRGHTVEPFAPEILLLRLRDVEIAPKDFWVLAERQFALIDGLVNWAQHYAQRSRYVVHQSDDGRLLLDLPSQVQDVDAPCAILGGGGDLYAWMFEGVARLWGLEQRAAAAALPLVVPDSLDRDRLELLQRLGVGDERLLPLAEDRMLRCRELWLSALPILGDWASPMAVQYLRRKFLGLLREPCGRRRRLYISRRDCDTRHLANENELLPLIEAKGFEVVRRENLSLLELLAAFSEAEAILAADDDALACLVVAPQGARVGTIASKGIYRPRAYCVSAQIGHAFTYLQAEPVFASHSAHAECDVSLLADSLREWLNSL